MKWHLGELDLDPLLLYPTAFRFENSGHKWLMELNRNWLYVECNYIEKGNSFYYCFGLQNRNKFGIKFGKGVWFHGGPRFRFRSRIQDPLLNLFGCSIWNLESGRSTRLKFKVRLGLEVLKTGSRIWSLDL